MHNRNPSPDVPTLGVHSDPPMNPMRVRKETQPIILVLHNNTQVRGLVHLPPSGRISDLMNLQAAERPFLPVTRAAVRFPDGTNHKVPFLAVNRSSVSMCLPLVEQTQAPAGKRAAGAAEPRPQPAPAGAAAHGPGPQNGRPELRDATTR